MPGIVNGKPVEPQIFMAVLYDPATGHIAHYHRVLQFDPKETITQAHVEERIKGMATRHGWDVSKLETLHVDFAKVKRGARYKVHPGTRTLVELPQAKLPGHDSPLRLRS